MRTLHMGGYPTRCFVQLEEKGAAMKKQSSRISLARETVHRLDRRELSSAAGGMTYVQACITYWCSYPKTCSYTSC